MDQATETTSDGRPECFVISPIGEDGSPIRDRANIILEIVIAPAAEECSYRAVRADHIAEPGPITRQVIDYVIEAPMAVADLTGHNANVLYEVALRHAFGLPIVKIIEDGERNPFDIIDSRTIRVKHQDVRSVDACRKAIVAQMQAILAA